MKNSFKRREYDVVIIGAGCAGFVAAVASARQGVKVALIEKELIPGGLLTAGGSNSIDQFNNPYRKSKKMIIAGLGWEFVGRLADDGYASIPDMYAKRTSHEQYGVKVNPAAAAKAMDDMLIEAGVDLYYGQPAVSVMVEKRKIGAALISTKEGLCEICGKVFVDCTGDGDFAYWAGAECDAGGSNGEFQPGTLRFYPAFEAKDKIINYGDNTNHFPLDVTDSDEITKSNIAARQAIYEQMKKGLPVMMVANGIAPREGRRIRGLSVLSVSDYYNGVVFPDSVCYSYWFIDIHRDGQPAYIKYIESDKTPTIPLSAMIAKDFDNLLMAGRNISSDRETNASLRVKASCMAMGEAVGVACAVFVKNGLSAACEIPAETVKRLLHEQGALVPGIKDGADIEDL